MCSACTSSSPAAVKSAAEQSARSLMFGLYAARRSTAPISSATPVSREIEDLQRRRVEGSALTCAPSPTRRARPARRPSRRAPTPCSRARPRPSGPTTRGAVDQREARPIVSGAARDARARSATTSIGAPGRANPLRRSCSAGKSAGRGTVSSWLWPAYRQSTNVSTSSRGHRPPPTPRAPARPSARSSPSREPGVGHDRTSSRRRGDAHEPDGREHTGARRDDHRAHPERVGDTRTRGAAPRRRTRRARGRAGRRPARR